MCNFKIQNLPTLHVFQILLSIEDTLYYHAVTARSLYKINIELLTDSTKTEEEVESGVTFVCYSGMPDGMVLAGDEQLRGTLYMTAVEKDGVDYLSSDGFDRVLPFVSDPLLQVKIRDLLS